MDIDKNLEIVYLVSMAEVLIAGNDGRAQALAWGLVKFPDVSKVHIISNSAGTKFLGPKAVNVDLEPFDFERYVRYAKDKKINLVIFSPESLLFAGGSDVLNEAKIPTFGPIQKLARLESSRIYCYEFLKRLGVPQPEAWTFINYQKAKVFIESSSYDLVIKPDGPAQGKGVTVASSKTEAIAAAKALMVDKVLGQSGEKILIQKRVFGREASVIAITDGDCVRMLPIIEDHKAVNDQDLGPNTGGMGAVGPVDYITHGIRNRIHRDILQPIVSGIYHETKERYIGALFPGIMLTDEGPQVLEVNCRLGHPETDVLVRLLKSNLFKILESCTKRALASQEMEFFNGVAASVVLTSQGYPGNYQTGDIIYGLNKKYGEDIVIFHSGTKEDSEGIKTAGGRVLDISCYRSSIHYLRAFNPMQEALNYALNRVYSTLGEKGIHFAKMHYRTDIGRRG